MVTKGPLVVLILTALVMRTCTPIKQSCTPLGFREFEPLMSYLNAEDTGFLTLYVLYTPRNPGNWIVVKDYGVKEASFSCCFYLLELNKTQVSFIDSIFIIIIAALFRKNLFQTNVCEVILTNGYLKIIATHHFVSFVMIFSLICATKLSSLLRFYLVNVIELKVTIAFIIYSFTI